jgi:PAS domain S-box-containing protein
MSDSAFEQQLSSALERVAELQQKAERAEGEESRDLFAEGLEELGVAFEELRVAQEHLQTQNEALVAAEAEADAERERYQDLFEYAPSGYLVTDADGVIRRANLAAGDLLNVPPNYLVDKPLTVFVGSEDRDVFLGQLSGLQAGQRARTRTVRIQPRPEGSGLRIAELTVVPFRDPESRGTQLRWQLRDVTEQHQVGAELRRLNVELEARVQLRTAALAEMLKEKSAAERRLAFLCDAGRAFASSLDFAETLDNIAGQVVPAFGDWCFVELVDPEGTLRRYADRGLAEDQPPRLRAWEEAHSRVWTAADLPTRKLLVADTAVPPPGLSPAEADQVELFAALGWRAAQWLPLIVTGQTIGALCVGSGRPRSWSDSDRQLAGELARQVGAAVRNADLVRQLAQSDRRKDEFLATLAHELRNPLTAIGNAAHLLRAQVPPGGEVPPAVGVIERQARRIAHLVNDLLDVSRIARGTLLVQMTTLNLADVAATATEAVRPTANGLDLWTDLPGEPVWVRADPGRLDQVLTNLLTNAIKFTDSGGSVTVKVERAGGAAVVRVKDTGVGIPADLLPRLFGLFVQADPGRDRAQGGLGIGLHLVKRLVELHGGTVEARSAGPGTGSEFIIRLPEAGEGETSQAA